MHVWCDNFGANYLLVNPLFHSKMKHMALAMDYYFAREQVAEEIAY